MNPVTDPAALREGYATSERLMARRSIYAYHQEPFDLGRWLTDLIGTHHVGRVLDVGCGPGSALAQLAGRASGLTGLDLSFGMACEASRVPGVRAAVADAQHLPVPDRSYDTVLAMHMLYHVPRVDLAIAELRRVLRRGGLALVTTNGLEHLSELRDLTMLAAGTELTGSSRLFSLEDAPSQLARSFANVERRDISGQLTLPEPAPVEAYIDSTRAIFEPQLPAGRPWAAFLEAAGALVRDRISRDGAFRIRTHAGAFICS